MSLTLIKLGGSLITDKRVESAFRQEVVQRLAQEISAVWREQPTIPLIIGHGSGSFGHFAANRYGTINGVQTPEQWIGFAEVAAAAAELNYRVAGKMRAAGLPVWRLQPSASLICRDGVIEQMALHPLLTAVQHGVIPLVYGDVALDTVRGGTIASTETIFTYLVQQLPVQRVLLLGEVPGVYDPSGQVIPEITPANFDTMRDFLGGSEGIDVTGGMLTKVSDMLALVRQQPGLQVRIIDGTVPDLLREVLASGSPAGTLIHAG